ncbi:MAG: OadG family protein [Bacteroidales bacterium]|nr:OadG family protein [Bacteroidales bacterium]
MKTINKMLLAGLLSVTMLTAVAQEQPAEPRPEGCPMPQMAPTVDFASVKTCYVPQLGAFVAVDSVECCVHLVALVDGNKLDTVGCFKTDNTRKRHDLKNILRPVSVSAMGDYIIVLASAVNDTAYIAILDNGMNELARRSFSSPMYAMHIAPGKMFIVGRNPYGYDINILSLEGCPVKAFAEGEMMTHHYRVAKQAEKIKQSDPIGIGLAAVAVAVVFLALVCIFLLISGSGKLIMSTEEKRKNKGSKKDKAIKPVSEGSSTQNMEVYAAIAAAIHLYNDELHDEENTVITIQKVEREWTPWNAKYYNMNHYFNNRR